MDSMQNMLLRSGWKAIAHGVESCTGEPWDVMEPSLARGGFLVALYLLKLRVRI